ncbi:PREDICTED: tRNA-dihydrouridine(20a/20b) synthase [NAD(P)+]-like isoform X2 [Nicrophorus vespilloides]|nr:PREDICTED: tRNA-dihydrouridine(20a/20b) synthase [NAD(P)+]-like isoform X2 [Nicrophorus vespilloides]
MILADSFCKSSHARQNEFTTNADDGPLIVQFAANTVHEFVGAAYMVAPFCDGIDLNCGCPQRWAKQMGLGCAMLDDPEVISNIIKECRNTIPKQFSVSVKMRILNDDKKTVDLCRQFEHAGASFLSVHARTASQSTGDINRNVLKLIQESVRCPIVANGGLTSLNECDELALETGCKGVMVANSLLTNPMLFTGASKPTLNCVQKWINICYNSTVPMSSYSEVTEPKISSRPLNLNFHCFHHHLVFMLEKILPKYKRRVFNKLKEFDDVLAFLEAELLLKPQLYDVDTFRNSYNLTLDYKDTISVYTRLRDRNACNEAFVDESNEYNSEATDGSYFNKKLEQVNEDDVEEVYDWDSLYK